MHFQSLTSGSMLADVEMGKGWFGIRVIGGMSLQAAGLLE